MVIVTTWVQIIVYRELDLILICHQGHFVVIIHPDLLLRTPWAFLIIQFTCIHNIFMVLWGWDSCRITTNFLHFSAFLWNFFEIYKFYHPKNHKSIRTKAVKFLFSVTAFCLFLKSFTVRLMKIFELIWGICHDFSVLDTSSVQIFSYGIVKEQKFQ